MVYLFIIVILHIAQHHFCLKKMYARTLTPITCFVRFGRLIVKDDGSLAQLVEQRTENPCVGGSIPPGATIFLGHITDIYFSY